MSDDYYTGDSTFRKAYGYGHAAPVFQFIVDPTLESGSGAWRPARVDDIKPIITGNVEIHIDELEDLAKTGNRLATTGNQLAETGNLLAESGNQLITTGNQLLETGNSLVESGNDYLASLSGEAVSANSYLSAISGQGDYGNDFLDFASGQSITSNALLTVISGYEETGNNYLASISGTNANILLAVDMLEGYASTGNSYLASISGTSVSILAAVDTLEGLNTTGNSLVESGNDYLASISGNIASMAADVDKTYSSVSRVTATGASTLFSGNANRKELFVQNMATGVLYVAFSAAADGSNFDLILPADTASRAGNGGIYFDDNYTGLISASGNPMDVIAWQKI